MGDPLWCPLFRRLWGLFGRHRWVLGGAWGYITVIRHNLFISFFLEKIKTDTMWFFPEFSGLIPNSESKKDSGIASKFQWTLWGSLLWNVQRGSLQPQIWYRLNRQVNRMLVLRFPCSSSELTFWSHFPSRKKMSTNTFLRPTGWGSVPGDYSIDVLSITGQTS